MNEILVIYWDNDKKRSTVLGQNIYYFFRSKNITIRSNVFLLFWSFGHFFGPVVFIFSILWIWSTWPARIYRVNVGGNVSASNGKVPGMNRIHKKATRLLLVRCYDIKKVLLTWRANLIELLRVSKSTKKDNLKMSINWILLRSTWWMLGEHLW